MSDYKVIDGTFINQGIGERSTTKKEQLGRTVRARDMASTGYGDGEFIYLTGVASTVVGSVVTFEEGTNITTLTVANAKGRIGVAMSASVAGEYGWYQIRGRAVCEVLTSCAADKVLYLTATAGELDDAVVVGDEVYTSYSLTAIATPAAGQAEVSICYPFVTDASN